MYNAMKGALLTDSVSHLRSGSNVSLIPVKLQYLLWNENSCSVGDCCTHTDCRYHFPDLQGWAKKVIPLEHYVTLYERYHFFGPPCMYSCVSLVPLLAHHSAHS